MYECWTTRQMLILTTLVQTEHLILTSAGCISLTVKNSGEGNEEHQRKTPGDKSTV